MFFCKSLFFGSVLTSILKADSRKYHWWVIDSIMEDIVVDSDDINRCRSLELYPAKSLYTSRWS